MLVMCGISSLGVQSHHITIVFSGFLNKKIFYRCLSQGLFLCVLSDVMQDNVFFFFGRYV
jgi:hypothetical protein